MTEVKSPAAPETVRASSVSEARAKPGPDVLPRVPDASTDNARELLHRLGKTEGAEPAGNYVEAGGKPDKAAEQTGRKQETSSRGEQPAENPVTIWKRQPVAEQAKSRLAEYHASVAAYRDVQARIPGLQEHPAEIPKVLAKLGRISQNFTRMAGDFVQFWKGRKESGELPGVNVDVTVLNRQTVLADERFMSLLDNPDNVPVMANLLNQEVFKEANCTSFLMVEGASVAQFQALMKEMGYNPRAFLSDNRGENAGRIAIDNEQSAGDKQENKHPVTGEPMTDTEARYWKHVVDKPSWMPDGLWQRLPMSKWSMSRTHGVMYDVKRDGRDVLLLPIHVDPKNAVAVFAPKGAEEPSALVYHQMSAGETGDYLGTGLYDLADTYMIRLLQQARDAGKVGRVRVTGERALRTTGTISGDDEITWAIRSKPHADREN